MTTDQTNATKKTVLLGRVLMIEMSFFIFSPRSRDWYRAECVNYEVLAIESLMMDRSSLPRRPI